MKKFLKEINKSKSYSEARKDIVNLMKASGISESFLEAESKKGESECTYDMGMYISKVYGIYNVVPKMAWLPYEIRKLY